MRADLLLSNIGQLVTMAGGLKGPKLGAGLGKVEPIQGAAVAIRDGEVVALGPEGQVRSGIQLEPDATEIDLGGKLAMPGFVDPHTHAVFAGSREDEFVLRLGGATYSEILASGGGIMSTVIATRQASFDELLALGRERLLTMLAHGTTTVEVKTGYGLDTETELKLLKVAKELARQTPLQVAITFMGAHVVPSDYRERPDRYVDIVVEEMIPAVAQEGGAKFCDVFCEAGVFTPEQSRRILEAGLRHGMIPRLHADELEASGGSQLAAALGAVSADHLVHVPVEGIAALAENGVVAVLLPGTTFSLPSSRYAPARDLIAAGVPVALATDYNPGTCPTPSMQMVMALACRQMRMTPAEALAAATVNAAHSLQMGGAVGSLAVGMRADLAVFDVPSYDFIPWHFGTNLVDKVFAGGALVVDGGKPVYS